MSKTWYPVIDYERCTECGVCIEKCKNGVYDLMKVPKPVVIIPENCIHGCHGCGNLCPTEAISYVGNQRENSGFCGCSCGNEDGGCC
ncbi:4Fe-4S dicluster domain-containing protein [Calidifontibacillus oryziterrae]|uniref:4Fe-4S dicluster domain-containing protein n=1 Tax=Calidifontibacillus oryziterrae TaxID=1191699 RepID=UPI0008FBDF7E|nr:4Fe-4S binding protein [Calidifontibacillus oryziterrae]